MVSRKGQKGNSGYWKFSILLPGYKLHGVFTL